MGTGVTTTGSCRVGTANVGDLINARNPTDIDYQRKMCSGDTTTGFNRQIDEWTNPEKADIATVTMGGNDLGFSDIVMNCILAPELHWPSTYRQRCKAAKENANRILEDDSQDGIGPRLTAAYKRIVEKSTRDVSISTRFTLFSFVYTDYVQSGFSSLRLWLSRRLF
jgi:lysophospholipase L1-like esterase